MRKFVIRSLTGAVLAFAALQPAFAQRVEYFWDDDPGVGMGMVLQNFSGKEAAVEKNLDVSKLSAGIHRIGLRALNEGRFSKTYYRSFYVPPVSEEVTRVEYAWDKIPAPGTGTAIKFTKGSSIDISASLNTTTLSTGMHTLYIQALSNGHQSQTYSRSFYVPATPHKVKAIEYWFDEDPGVGQATRKSATIEGESLTMAFDVETEGLSEGVHHIGIRTLTDGTWSETKVRQFLVRQTSDIDNYITRLEYFWNNDPGEGRGAAVDITAGTEVEVDFMADMTELGEGPHMLGLRAMSGSRAWSAVYQVTDIAFEGWDNLQDYLNSLADTPDTYIGNSYTRHYGNKDWHALYVPFSLSYSDWSLHFEVARINAFYQYDDDEDGVVDRQVLEAILVRQGNGSLKANHPYLIRAKQKGDYTFSVETSKQAPEEINSISCSTVEARYTFTGNYSELSGLKSANRYRLMGNTLSIPDTDEEVLPPYRWYLTIDDLGNQLQPSAARVLVRIIGDDNATLIDDIQMDDIQDGKPQVYDLQGRRVIVNENTKLSYLTKGIYIINNKKYVIK